MEVSGQLHASSRFTPRERAPGTCWIGGKGKVELSLCLYKYHAMKTYCGSGEKTSELDGGKLLASRSGRFTPGKESLVPIVELAG